MAPVPERANSNKPPAVEAAMPIAFVIRSASNCISRPHATAAPNGPVVPGAWKPRPGTRDFGGSGECGVVQIFIYLRLIFASTNVCNFLNLRLVQLKQCIFGETFDLCQPRAKLSPVVH
jgi:hypothetical protein